MKNTIVLSEPQMDEALKIRDILKPAPVFSVDGEGLFLGDINEAAKRYAAENSSKSLWVWCCDNYKRLE